MGLVTNMKKSWFYWMYKWYKKTGFGSTVPDFNEGLITQKQFYESIAGQTVHTLDKKEQVELKKLASITDTSKIPYFRKEGKK